jgi:hypothetical protein
MAAIDKAVWRRGARPRRAPYWKRITRGRFIGWRKLTAGSVGSWLARSYDGEGGYPQRPLGDFGDRPEAERFDAALAEAVKWFEHLDMGGTSRPATVRAVCEAHVEKARAEKGEPAARDTEGFFRRLVYGQPIARASLAKLSKAHCAAWRAWLLDYCEGNKSSFNRNITPLRAALNQALDDGKAATDQAWRTALRPFGKREGGGGKRRQLYLNADARRKLIEHASDEARPLLIAMNLQPVRPGDIPSARVQDLDIHNRSLKLAGKGNERTIPLGREAFEHFKACAKGKLPTAWLVARPDGSQWKKEAWRDEVKAAAKAAKLPAATVANTLRHSVITDLVKHGLDVFHVAAVSGTSIKMVEEHYGHLQHEHVRDALDKLALG